LNQGLFLNSTRLTSRKTAMSLNPFESGSVFKFCKFVGIGDVVGLNPFESGSVFKS